MKQEHEYRIKTRLLRVMRALIDSPSFYTVEKLSNIYGVDKSTIRNDLNAFKEAGFVCEYDEKYRYRFVNEKPFKKLEDLLHFSEEDQALLTQAIDQIENYSERGKRLKKKLAALYDYRRLGHAYLRKPYLSKVDLLTQAKDEERQIILKQYRSANRIADRLVEPFHISPPDDTVQAYDVTDKALKHFRISRIQRVELTDEPWQFKGHHNILLTDPFRIVDNRQVLVHLRIGVGAYNELTERFPLTKARIEETGDPEIFDFQCMVNHKFIGLTNFILGFHHQFIEVLEPESLIVHLRNQIKKMNF